MLTMTLVNIWLHLWSELRPKYFRSAWWNSPSQSCWVWPSAHSEVFNWRARLQASTFGWNQYTPLHCAATNGCIDNVKFEKHCDPMSSDSDQDTLLHMAALNSHIQVVKFLTTYTYDPTKRIADTVICNTVNQHLDIVQFFISDQNCDPNNPLSLWSSYFVLQHCNSMWRGSDHDTKLHRSYILEVVIYFYF